LKTAAIYADLLMILNAAHFEKRAQCPLWQGPTPHWRKSLRRRAAKKKRQHEAGVKLLRQVSYRQETYRAVTPL
jgi:hypothetical protein